MRHFRAIPLFLLFAASFAIADSIPNPHTLSIITGIPHPLTLAYDYRVGNFFSIGAATGYFTYTYRLSSGDDVDLSSENYDIRARIHPFSGSFFFGVIAGTRTYKATSTRDIPLASGLTIPVTGTLSISSYYLTPHIGWLWTNGGGFSLGIELGCQIPLSPSTELNIPVVEAFAPEVKQTSEYKRLESDINGPALQIGKTPLPYLALLRLGWTF